MAINVTHSKVSTIPDGDDTSLIRPSDWNDDHVIDGLGTMAEQNANAVAITGGTISGVTLPASNITGTLDVPHGGTGATTLTGYVKGAGTTALTAFSTIPNTDITGLGTASTKDAGVALGVATLDAGGTVPLSQIPASIIGGLNYQGTWNASTNTPALTSSVGTKGYYYAVSVSGTTNLNGITDWFVGDLAVFDGSAWQQIDNTDAVTSVNGYTGTVVLTQPDIAGTANAPTNTNITSMTGLTGGISSPDYIAFDTTYATPLTAGQLGWDGNNTLAIGMAGGNVTQHIGEDLYFYYKATSAVTKGQVVMFTGAVGASGVPTGAPATGITDGTYIMGIAAESVALNGFGLVQSFGELRNVNTVGYADGDILWYDPAVTGGLTKTKPVAPNIKVQMAAVINGGSSGGGTILIRINSGSTLGGTDSNAQITSPTNGQIISYDGADGYWKNTDLTAGTAIAVSKSANGVLTVNNTGVTSAVAGTGISVSSSTGAVTVTNTAPDQTVSLTAGTGISTTGTYPNFTITNTAPSSGGTVTSITAGTGLTGGTITSSGTIAIDSTVATLTGSQILTNKTISGASNTLSNIGNSSLTNSAITINGTSTSLGGSISVGTVTSVTATSPVTSTGGNTPVIAMPAATGSVNGYLTSTDWTTFNSKQPAGTYVNSVSATSPITSSGGVTPTIAIPAATGSVNGYLTSTDWTTFNSKAPAVTYTTNYVPYGQGTTTPALSSSFTYDPTLKNLTAPQVKASNGIVVNSKTIAASYSIASGDCGMSVGPVTVASGQSVTVASGSRWVVL